MPLQRTDLNKNIPDTIDSGDVVSVFKRGLGGGKGNVFVSK